LIHTHTKSLILPTAAFARRKCTKKERNKVELSLLAKL